MLEMYWDLPLDEIIQRSLKIWICIFPLSVYSSAHLGGDCSADWGLSSFARPFYRDQQKVNYSIEKKHIFSMNTTSYFQKKFIKSILNVLRTDKSLLEVVTLKDGLKNLSQKAAGNFNIDVWKFYFQMWFRLSSTKRSCSKWSKSFVWHSAYDV